MPFLGQRGVAQYGWLDQRQFLIAVAVGMISPSPVVITAAFVGYLVAGFWGSVVATVGIFLASFILVLGVAPLPARWVESQCPALCPGRLRGRDRNRSRLHPARPHRRQRWADGPYRRRLARGPIPLIGLVAYSSMPISRKT